MRIKINGERLSDELEQLACFSDAPAPAVTRILYSEQDLKARDFIKGLAEKAELSIREDALGNTFFRLEGSDPSLSAVATGSHIDAIPHSGRYDGTVGVLGGLEALRALKESGLELKRSLELILFTAEEPTRFGVGCLGSRAMAGTLSLKDILELKDEDGKSPDEVRREAGFKGELEDVQLSQNTYHAFVELHIEQGPLLEQKNMPIGVVTAIAAPSTLHIKLEGEGGHAGAVLMPQRKDALLAAAEIALSAEEAARTSGSIDSVATVGILDVHPRAVNSIPSRAFMTLDVRDTNLARRDKMIEDIKEAAETITADRKIKLTLKTINADPPATCSEHIIHATEAAARNLGLDTLPMVSRAYHDTLFMARICSVGMIFIPCKDGISHRPDEYASPKDINKGVRVLAQTLADLAS